MECGSAKREAAPRPGRDNSVSSSRHNLLTASFWTPNHREMESVYGNNYCKFNYLSRITTSVSQSDLLHRADTTILQFTVGGLARDGSTVFERFFTGSSPV